jgi:hypothetical protein
LCLCPAHETPATPLLPCHLSKEVLPPLAQNTKAAAIAISGLIHMASALAVYASSFGFPYTGKTRFRWVASPFRVGFEPTGLYWRISKRLLHRLSQRPRLCLAPLHFALPGRTGGCPPEPPQNRTSAISAYGSSGLWFRYAIPWTILGLGSGYRANNRLNRSHGMSLSRERRFSQQRHPRFTCW